jgi:biotin carboxyl carrier protein
MALRIGELLVKAGALTEEGLAAALDEQRRAPGQRLGEVLVRLGLVDEVTLVKELARQLGLLRVQLELMPPPPPDVLARVPADVARRLKVIPLHLEGSTLGVVMTDPSNELQVRELAALTGSSIEPLISTPTQLAAFIERSYGPAPEATSPASDVRAGLFRREALEAAEARRRSSGQVLSLTPAWLEVSFGAVLVMALTAVAALLVVRVGDYAEGPALVRARGQVAVSTATAGVVADLFVRPGDVVTRGQPLVGFERASLVARLDALEEEIRGHVLRTLTRPDDAAAAAALSRLYAERDEARVRLDALVVRAPGDGRVTEVTALVGQPREAGDVVARLERQDGTFFLVGAAQGEFRPLLAVGQPMTVEFDGYPNLVQTVTLTRLSEAVVGPDEVRRYLGRASADLLVVQGPRVLLEGEFEARSFTFRGREVPLVDGLTGRVHVCVRTQRLLVALVPALREFLGDG